MRDHPLTPMTDANLVRVLGRQTKARVDLVPYSVVCQGPEAIAAAFIRMRIANVTHAIVDAVEDRHLLHIGTACADMRLITGGSGVALGLPDNFRRAGLLAADVRADSLPSIPGREAVIAGSCSAATLAQIGQFRRSRPALAIDPKALALGEPEVQRAIDWARGRLESGPTLIYASAPPDVVAHIQAQLGRERAGAMIERALAEIAAGLVAAGVRRLIVAGGETSGAVMQRLGAKALRIGPQIDPGVPWTVTAGEPRLALALKSGNFGKPDFFTRAFGVLP